MAYSPTTWVDRSVSRPRTYTMVNNGDGTYTLTPSEGTISAAGTPINSAAMAKIENELVALDAFMNKRVSCSETSITATTATNVLTFTPTAQGNFEIKAYLRVVTAPTVITVTATYTDAGGSQTVTLYTGTAIVGSWMLPMYFLNSAANQAITLTIIAGTANQVYVSASIVGV